MGLGVVAIADPPTAIRLKVPFSDGLGGGIKDGLLLNFAKNKGIVKSEIRIKFRFISTHCSKKQLCLVSKNESNIE